MRFGQIGNNRFWSVLSESRKSTVIKKIFVCPKCGASRSAGEECQTGGVVFKKYTKIAEKGALNLREMARKIQAKKKYKSISHRIYFYLIMMGS